MNMSTTTIYLAPFQGITDAAYRNGFRIYFGGIDKFYCPYISGITGNRVSRSKVRDLQPEKNNLDDTVPQVLSKDAEEILIVAEQIANWGYTELNWNLGCPFPRVAKKSRGSGLLPYPEKIRDILDKVMPEIKIHFSVKLRSGYQSHEEIFRVLEILNNYPIHDIILHPRTGSQLYRGKAKPEIFSEVKKLTNHRIIYNGDIYSHEDYLKVRQICDPAGWMIGRGALRYPFLPSMLKGQDWEESSMRKSLEGFHDYIAQDAMTRLQGRVQILDRMKPIWAYMCHVFQDPLKVYRKIRKTRTIEEYTSASGEIISHFPIKLKSEPFSEKNPVMDGNYE